MEPLTLLLVGSRAALTAVAKAFVAALWKAYKSKIVLGAAIFGFSVGGLAMIIGSRTVTGWNQIALLGFGTSLLIVGTVELGILGVLHKIIDPDRTDDVIRDLHKNLAQRFTALEGWLGMPPFQPAPAPEIVIVHKTAGGRDHGVADGNRGD
jgi:hypothetical protein